jgi:hypothetical protein
VKRVFGATRRPSYAHCSNKHLCASYHGLYHTSLMLLISQRHCLHGGKDRNTMNKWGAGGGGCDQKSLATFARVGRYLSQPDCWGRPRWKYCLPPLTYVGWWREGWATPYTYISSLVGSTEPLIIYVEFSLNSPSYVCVLPTDGDLVNTKSACAPRLNPLSSQYSHVCTGRKRCPSLYSISLLCGGEMKSYLQYFYGCDALSPQN